MEGNADPTSIPVRVADSGHPDAAGSQTTLLGSVLSSAIGWYNQVRPHSSLGGATPSEVHADAVPANELPRVEPRARYPSASPCSRPCVPVGSRAELIELRVRAFDGHRQLPVVEIRVAA